MLPRTQGLTFDAAGQFGFEEELSFYYLLKIKMRERNREILDAFHGYSRFPVRGRPSFC